MESENRKSRSLLGSMTIAYESLRQLLYPPEFRIFAPVLLPGQREIGKEDPAEGIDRKEPEPGMGAAEAPDREQADPFPISLKVFADAVNCLWYLKTKFFKREWDSEDTGDDDPRVRKALSRINRVTEKLNDEGLAVVDPTNKRYPPGSEGLMKPLHMAPTRDFAVETVTDTVTPIIYLKERLFQRGEVFVAVPVEEEPKAAAKEAQSPTPMEASENTDPAKENPQLE